MGKDMEKEKNIIIEIKKKLKEKIQKIIFNNY